MILNIACENERRSVGKFLQENQFRKIGQTVFQIYSKKQRIILNCSETSWHNLKMYKFFWSGPFSQWANLPFEIDRVKFITCEQYMMYMKALLFNDYGIAELILKTSNPKEQKVLGRKVQNFNDAKWMQHAYQYVVDGNREKFSQNENLGNILKATKGLILVEASPYDCRWGIGMAASDPGVNNPANWKGDNLLGKAITQVRIELFGE